MSHRKVLSVVLAVLLLATLGCGPGGLTSKEMVTTVQALVDVVRQTDGVRQAGGFSTGFVYLIEDGRAVRAWELSEGQLMEIAPDVADVKLDAVDGGCLPDGSIESGMTRVITITSPTEAEAVFAVLAPHGYYSLDLKLEKVDDRWQVSSERETRLDLVNQCEPAN